MLVFERFFRRVAYSFGVAGLLTIGFKDSLSYFQIPLITYIVATILLLFSWRIQKEYKEIILTVDGPNAVDPSQNWFGHLYDKNPHQYHTLWEGFYTFGAILIITIVFDNFGYDVYSKTGYMIGFLCVLFFIIMRFFDPKSKSRYYKK